jgi:hypothetical protein
MIADSDELEMFNSETLKAMLEYKWNSYAVKHHYVGFLMHLLLILILLVYILFIYMKPYTHEVHTALTIALGIAILYPWIYDLI